MKTFPLDMKHRKISTLCISMSPNRGKILETLDMMYSIRHRYTQKKIMNLKYEEHRMTRSFCICSKTIIEILMTLKKKKKRRRWRREKRKSLRIEKGMRVYLLFFVQGGDAKHERETRWNVAMWVRAWVCVCVCVIIMWSTCLCLHPIQIYQDYFTFLIFFLFSITRDSTLESRDYRCIGKRHFRY